MVKLDNTNRRTVLKGIGASAVGGALFSGTASAKTTATAELQDFTPQEGPRENETTVEGTIWIEDKPDEKDIVVTGEATGLNPDHFYISLFYDKQSPGPGEDRACEPSLECLPPGEEDNPGWCLSHHQMLAAYWMVDDDGNGTAQDWPQEEPGPGGDSAEYAHLANLGTISIRNASMGFRREACGFIERD